MMYWPTSLAVLFATASTSDAQPSGLARRLLHSSDEIVLQLTLLSEQQKPNRGTRSRELEEIVATLEEKTVILCDAALSKCMGVGKCLQCYTELSSKDVDWASVPKDVSCKEALKYIYDGGHCSYLPFDTAGEEAFCLAFEACVRSDKSNTASKNTTKIDCSKLTSCDFEGKHFQFLGDGICHDNLPGCYNTAICGYDMGDCCKDSCESFSARGCGSEGYACRDPNSIDCDMKLTSECGKHEDWKDESDDFFDKVDCEEGKTSYRLVMYDSFGDGWDETSMKLTEEGTKTAIFDGALASGAMGTSYICLNSSPACYKVETKGGIWGKEVSWEVKPLREGAPAIASGGAPMDCQFGAGGASCESTCLGRADDDPSKDPSYKSLKELYKCMEDKCVIQMAACKADQSCNTCFTSETITPQYCYGVESFNSLVNCALCSCTDESKDNYCKNRDGQGDAPAGEYPFCSPTQIMQGGAALIEFNNCTTFDEFAMLMIEFDNDHFGDLDTFERCAHEYRKKEDHGGYTALGCLKILFNAIDGKSQVNKVDPATTDAIASLASLLYHDAEHFCDCASEANTNCPICDSFRNLKTLLYESVDACVSLDEIDCDAWTEFFPSCNAQLNKMFTNVDFNNPSVCQFVRDGCGDAGPFPSFRRLDCKDEVPYESWSFYESFSKGCLKDGAVAPQPAPQPQPVLPIPAAPLIPDSGSSSAGRKPYVPPEKRDKKEEEKKEEEKKEEEKKEEEKKQESKTDPVPDSSKGSADSPKTKKSHFFRNFVFLMIFGGGSYFYYKRYGLSLEGVQDFVNCLAGLRRGRGQTNYDGSMYSGLAMESSMASSTSFEPAFLPPPPSAVDGNYYI